MTETTSIHNQKIAQGTQWNFVGLIADTILGLANSVIVARMLGVSEFGGFSFYLWIIELATVFAFLGFNHSVARFTSESLGKGEERTASLIYRIMTKWETLMALVITTLMTIILYTQSDVPRTALLAGLCILPISMGGYLTYACHGLQDFRSVALGRWWMLSVRLIGYIAVWITGGGLREVLFVYLITASLQSIWLWFKSHQGFGPATKTILESQITHRILKFSGVMFYTSIVNLIITRRSEVFFLKIFHSPDEIAYFSVAFMLSSYAVMMPSTFAQVLPPIASRLYGSQEKEKLGEFFRTSTRLLGLVSLPMAFGGAAVSTMVIPILFGEGYANAIVPAVILFSFAAIGPMGASAASIAIGSEMSRIIIGVGTFSAILNLILCWWWIPSGSMIGAAMAHGVAQTIGGVLGFTLVSRRLETSFPLWDIVKLLTAAALSGLLCYSTGKLFPGWTAVLTAFIIYPLSYILLLKTFKAGNTEDAPTIQAFIELAPQQIRKTLASNIKKILSLETIHA